MTGPEHSSRARFGFERPSIALVIWLMAATYLAAHVPFLAKTPYDIDGVNFVLALHEYDLVKHQPHPPGSPLFIGLGRIARTTLGWTTHEELPSASARALDATALAVWSACFGALAAFALFRLFVGLGQPARRAVLTTALTLASPLFWFSGVRPMSDMPGLAVAALSLALIVSSLSSPLRGAQSSLSMQFASPAPLILGCFFAGLAPGMRLQMVWLTWPVALAAIASVARRDRRTAGFCFGSCLLGVAVWLLPLSVITGGPAEYVRVLRLQAAEDLATVQMLALNPTARGAVQALRDSLVAPWGEPWLGWIAIAVAVIGALSVLARQPRTALVLSMIFGPYAVLHLGFQDTSYVRYALPLVPLVTFFAAEGFALFGRVGVFATLGLAGISLAVAISAVIPQSRAPAPVYQAIDDVRERLTTSGGERPVLAMHHSIGQAVRGEQIAAHVLPSPLRYEWLELAKYWRAGGDAPVWFLASRRRTDLALVDPASRSVVRSYRYPARAGALLAGSRPRSVDWVEIKQPGWMALEGWSLTPEVRGVTLRDYLRNRMPVARALVRRRHDDVAVLLGGRNLGGPCSTGAMIKVWIDGREVHRFETRAGESFTQLWRLPAGILAGTGAFAELEVSTEDRSGAGQQVDVAFEQLDLQGAGHSVSGLAEGWFEPEYEPREGISFRWMSDRAAIKVDAFDRDVTLAVRGESPLRYFRQPSTVIVKAGHEVLAVRELDADFSFEIAVPARLLRASGGVIEVEASQAFVPNDRSWNGDRRALALKIFDVRISARGNVDNRAEARPRVTTPASAEATADRPGRVRNNLTTYRMAANP